MGRLLKWLMRHHRGVALTSALFTVIGLHFSILLYRNLRTGIEELLPRTARSVIDLERVTQRLESSSNLAILVSSRDTEASKTFVVRLAGELNRLRAAGLISRVEYRIDRELDFFTRRRALFIDLPDLRRIRDYVQDRIAYEETLRNPLTIFQEVQVPEPRLDLEGMQNHYSRQISPYTRFPGGFYASPDETMRVLLVYITGSASGIENALRLRAAVDQCIASLRPESFAPDLRIHFTGDVQNLIEENNSLLRDLELSAAVVPVLVLLAMILYFRDWLTTTALVLSLLSGTSVALGISYFLIGYLNANSAFLGSIVIGNGINFGIIVLARYIEERRRERPHEESVLTAFPQTATATLTAALAAGLAYGSLIATDFRGFRQFGLIGLIGMLCCWASAYTVLPVLLTLGENLRPFSRRKRSPNPGRFSRANAWFISRFPRLILATSVLLTAATIVSVISFRGTLFETDTTRLRDRTSLTTGSGFYSEQLDRIFQRYISPIVILPETPAQAREIARRLKTRQERDGKTSDLASVSSMEDFVPPAQHQKIRLLNQIRASLTPAVMRQLSAADRRFVRSFLTPEAFIPFSEKDLPETVLARFRERNGRTGTLVLVEPKWEHRFSRNSEYQSRFIATLRQITDSVSPGTPVVGQLPLTVDLQSSIRRDGPIATGIAAIAVSLLVLFLFRRLRTSIWVLLSLLLGTGWLGGALFFWTIRINFLNFIAIPITFGIGVDYALNTIQRYDLEGRGAILKAVRTTGGAVALASLTTIIGYTSLLLAGNQGFVSFGRIAIIGEVTCIFAALFTLPALIHLLDSRQTARIIPLPAPGQTKPAQERRTAA